MRGAVLEVPDAATQQRRGADRVAPLQVLDGIGHFPHQEAPDAVNEALVAHARA